MGLLPEVRSEAVSAVQYCYGWACHQAVMRYPNSIFEFPRPVWLHLCKWSGYYANKDTWEESAWK